MRGETFVCLCSAFITHGGLQVFIRTTGVTCLWRLRAAEHVSPRPVQKGGAVAIVKGAEVLGNRVGA